MKIISVAAAIILTTSAFAQNLISVVQVGVLPTFPTTSDTVKIATITRTPNWGESYGLSFVLSGDTIYITGCFLDGALTQPMVYYDTATVGILPNGNYHIVSEARLINFGACNNPNDRDTGQADFTVGFLSIGEQDGSLGISVFPNPSNTLQTILLNGVQNQNIEIDLFDAQGRLIRRVYRGFVSSDETNITADVSDLSPALYFYRIRHGINTRSLRFVKQ